MKIKPFCFLLASLSLAPSCFATVPAAAPAAKVAAVYAQDVRMQKLSAEFLRDLWQTQPDFAIYAGKFETAGRQIVYDQAELARQVAFNQRWLRRLQQIDPAQLSPGMQSDLQILQKQLQSDLWDIQTLREHEWNPSFYNFGSSFDQILNTEYAPREQRLRSLYQRLLRVPAYYAAARANINNPSREHTELAIAQSSGVAEVLRAANKAAQAAALSATEKAQFARHTAAALQAQEEYVAWLRSLLARKQAERSFRIGKDLYEAKFAHRIQSGFSGAESYQRAQQAKEQMLTRMDGLADQIWGKYMGDMPKPAARNEKIGKLIAKMSENHVRAEDFVSEVRKQLPQLQKWLLDKDLLGQDASKPLEVRETPAYQRGVTVASIEAPGPFRAQDRTYYNVSPLTDMSPQQAESSLREYNHWILQILNIHEAIPGHYTQLVYANRSPSLIKTLFGNGSMIEGWAVYGELMMMESGYGDNSPEMWLMYSKWNLRAICNTILDYQVHVLGQSREEALKLLTEDAFQSEAEAQGKWRRVQLTSVQLASYFSGFSAIHALREELKQKMGPTFNLKQFHEKFLSYGSAPVPMIRSMMLAELNTTGHGHMQHHGHHGGKQAEHKHKHGKAAAGEDKTKAVDAKDAHQH